MKERFVIRGGKDNETSREKVYYLNEDELCFENIDLFKSYLYYAYYFDLDRKYRSLGKFCVLMNRKLEDVSDYTASDKFSYRDITNGYNNVCVFNFDEIPYRVLHYSDSTSLIIHYYGLVTLDVSLADHINKDFAFLKDYGICRPYEWIKTIYNKSFVIDREINLSKEDKQEIDLNIKNKMQWMTGIKK